LNEIHFSKTHREDAGPSAKLILFECCNQTGCGRLRAVYRQRLNAVDPGEYL
jgi:hypothetical protein